MTSSRVWALAAAVALVAAACGDDSVGPATLGPPVTSPVSTSPVTMSPVGSDADALARTSWVAQGISVGTGAPAIIPGSEPTLEFGDVGRTVSGSTGCNLYSGGITIGAGTIAFAELAVTERGCPSQEIMEQEALFLAVLSASDTFTLADGVLEMRGAVGSVEFVAPAPVIDVPLDGTTWELETLIDGEAATSVLTTTFPTLRFDLAQDSLRGTTGCNDYGGMVTVSGTELVVSDLAWTEIGCERDVMRQEGFILEVLQSVSSFEIEGDRLTMSASGDRSLIFRSR